MLTILSIFGTRPEAVKVVPIIHELANYSTSIRTIVCVTAQHRQMLDQVLDLFQIAPDYDLNVMKEQQTLSQLTVQVLIGLETVLTETRPDWVLVQGDTTTTMAASLAAYYHQIKVGHVEAGLRTHNKYAPFPEEVNRRITGIVTDLHFAPTQHARKALLAEKIPDASIYVTGNTVVDALFWVRNQVKHHLPALPDGLCQAMAGKRLILVTGHRRESFGEGLEQICLALRELALSQPDILIVYPVHLNPNVRNPVNRILGDVNGIYLLDPLPYASFIWLQDQSYLIITDSGGIQEEASSLGKPVLVTREVTERVEGVEAGNALLVGTSRHQIISQVRELLADADRYRQMARTHNVYGDGQAAKRIVTALLEHS